MNQSSTCSNQQLQHTIEQAINHYQDILTHETKNVQQRNQFLVYLMYSTKIRHQQELTKLQQELHNVKGKQDQGQDVEQQMQNIGENVDGLIHQCFKLKSQNQKLSQSLDNQQNKSTLLDQQIQKVQQEIQQFRLKTDQWERQQLRWNRRKKEIFAIIQNAEKQLSPNAKIQLSPNAKMQLSPNAEEQQLQKNMIIVNDHEGKQQKYEYNNNAEEDELLNLMKKYKNISVHLTEST